MNSYSPILGVATASFEIIAGIWVLTRRGRKHVLWTTAALLFLLAGYQVFESIICWSSGPALNYLSRFAFLDITWLPPLSLLLISHITGPASPESRKVRRLANAALVLAALMSVWIVIDYRFITGTICEFMVAKYSYIEPYFHFYGAYYELTQLSTIFIPIWLMMRSDSVPDRRQLGHVMAGSLLFIIPSLFLGAVLPEKFNFALPSLMCHFAVFYALFLIKLAKCENTRAP